MGQPAVGALGTAVDRMSFAHDIVMMTESTIVVGIGSTEQHQVENFQFSILISDSKDNSK